MNLTTRQKQIYEKISSVDSSWTIKGFVKCWNDILQLNKFISVTDGKIILEFDDASSVLIKFTQENKVLLEERIYWNEKIPVSLQEKNNEVKQAAQSIKMLADSIISS